MKIERNEDALAETIYAWEQRAGESFTDYYMDDHVKPVSWAFWLLGKGYTEFAGNLIDRIQAGEYVDQEDKFYVNPQDYTEGESSFSLETHQSNIRIWAEFLTACVRYWKDIEAWFVGEEI